MAIDETGRTTFGLLGRTLGHSWSPLIHQQLGSVPYDLIELEPDEVARFVMTGAWRGLNVTIPYKKDVAALADETSKAVRRLGAANTLIRRSDGTVFADNTDVSGFSWLLGRFCTNRLGERAEDALAGHEVLVLGSGGASRAVVAALEDVGACPKVISRTGDDTYETISSRHSSAVLVVNSTPVGMYPTCPASPLEEATLASLPLLRGVLDVVYNPRRTGLCLEAQRLGIPCESGLGMLVAQAKRSSELFQGIGIEDTEIERIEALIRSQTENVILIGMPGSGKTGAGRKLAHICGRPFVDLDDAVRLEHDRSAAEIISHDGEEAFRAIETDLARTYGSRSGIVIACGGGIVTRPENYDLLHQNGTIVMLDRPLSELSSVGRPLSAAKGVEQIARERMGLYRSWADIILPCTGSASGDAQAIKKLLGM